MADIPALVFSSHSNPMTRITLTVLLSGFMIALASCAESPDLFQVETGNSRPIEATLSVCGTTSPLKQEGDALVGFRVINCDGSGHISIRSDSGTVVRCEIGYVTSPAPFSSSGFSHRFKMKDETCLQLRSIPIRLNGDTNLSVEAAKDCGLRNTRRHELADGEMELGYFGDEQTPATVDCIDQWSEEQLGGQN